MPGLALRKPTALPNRTIVRAAGVAGAPLCVRDRAGFFGNSR